MVMNTGSSINSPSLQTRGNATLRTQSRRLSRAAAAGPGSSASRAAFFAQASCLSCCSVCLAFAFASGKSGNSR